MNPLELEHNPFADNSSSVAGIASDSSVSAASERLATAAVEDISLPRTESHVPPSTMAQLDSFSIRVHDPLTVNEGVKSHTAYSVSTQAFCLFNGGRLILIVLDKFSLVSLREDVGKETIQRILVDESAIGSTQPRCYCSTCSG